MGASERRRFGSVCLPCAMPVLVQQSFVGGHLYQSHWFGAAQWTTFASSDLQFYASGFSYLWSIVRFQVGIWIHMRCHIA